MKGCTDRIGRILRKYNLRTIYKPHITINKILGNPKDKIYLENQGVYSISCGNCNKSYIGQTNRRISARLQEHKLNIKNKQTASALYTHERETGHKIDLNSCKQIANIDHYKTRIIREAIEIEKQGSLNKKDDALNLPSAWKSVINNYKHLTTHHRHLPLSVNNNNKQLAYKESEPTKDLEHSSKQIVDKGNEPTTVPEISSNNTQQADKGRGIVRVPEYSYNLRSRPNKKVCLSPTHLS